MKFISLILFCTFCFAQNAGAQDIYRTYRNARFGTSVRYPANLVTPQPESKSGDGRKFLSLDKKIELTVYGLNNTRNRSSRGEMSRAISDWKRDGARLTYSRALPNSFVLSGYIGADIFYEKTLLQRGVFHTFIWQYPQNLKKRLDVSVARSAASFFVGSSTKNVQMLPRIQTAPRPKSRSTQRPKPRISRPRATGGY